MCLSSCPYLIVELTPAIPVIGGILLVFVMAALLRTSWTDPGIIPRATAQEAADTERQIGSFCDHVTLSLTQMMCSLLISLNVVSQNSHTV